MTGALPSQPKASIDEGWTTVKSSKKKATVEKRPPLKLRALDWSVPIIAPGDFKDGAIGVAMVSQMEGEKNCKRGWAGRGSNGCDHSESSQ